MLSNLGLIPELSPGYLFGLCQNPNFYAQEFNGQHYSVPNHLREIIVENVHDTRLYFTNLHELETLSISRNLATVPSHYLEGCEKLDTVTLPPSTISIESYAFSGLINLRRVFFSSRLASIGRYAFYDCQSLNTIDLTNIKEIGVGAFKNCQMLNNINISANIEELPEEIFENCQMLNRINLNTGLTTVRENAFNSCTSLGTIILPDTVTHVEKFAFMNCDKRLEAEIKSPDTASNWHPLWLCLTEPRKPGQPNTAVRLKVNYRGI
jgi:hypothetical protein